MHRWERSHGHIGVVAPSWLTFEVHRPYFDGAESPLTAMQARGAVLAASLYAAGDPQAPRFSMVMPASYRQLLIEESRLTAYRVATPADLPQELASPAWQDLARAYRDRDELDAAGRAGLAQWLVAACLPEAVLELAPADLSSQQCGDPLPALVQYARATALFQLEGLGERTTAAFRPLLAEPVPTVAHVQAFAGWAYLLARHASEASATAEHAATAGALLERLEPDLTPLRLAFWRCRLLIREVMYAERDDDLTRAWDVLAEASSLLPATGDLGADDALTATELRRRVIDRRVEIAARRGDEDAVAEALAEGIELDPYCVRIRMQQAQAAQRRDDLAGALEAYLLAARLGPYGTGFALLQAAECAGRLDRAEFATALTERAFRAAPRSQRTRTALLQAYRHTGEGPLEEVVQEAAPRPAMPRHRNNWHYQMYAAYFDLGQSRSPCLYARLPSFAFEFAAADQHPRLDVQRVMPPAFRTNLLREAGLPQFAVSHPAELPMPLRTPEWEMLCEWLADFAGLDLRRQYLVCKVLFRLGLRKLIFELLPERPVASLSEPYEFYQYRWRDLARYAASVGGRAPVRPTATFDMVDNPGCPLHLKLTASTFGVVFAARETRSLDDAVHWRARAKEYLDEVLASDDFTAFEKGMLESRFYRGVGFVPFMRGDAAGTIADMDRAEELARSVPANSEWEQLLKRENLHACIQSRAKEAFGLGQQELGHRRTEEYLALDPYDPKSHRELADSLAKQGRHLEAADEYLRSARLGPMGTAMGYAFAGQCHELLGEHALAEDCFVQALRIDPYAVTAARGWREVATDGTTTVAAEYALQLEEWGAARMGQR